MKVGSRLKYLRRMSIVIATFSNNIIKDLTNNPLFACGSFGIGVWSEANVFIRNNVISDSMGAIVVNYSSSNLVTDNLCVIRNNTIINNYNFGIMVNEEMGLTNPNKITNNIIVNTQYPGWGFQGYGILAMDGANILSHNDVWNNVNNYGVWPGATSLTHTSDINQNPRLVYNGNGMSDGYYLSQVGGDVNLSPAQNLNITGITPFNADFYYQTIAIYATNNTTPGDPLGYYESTIIFDPGFIAGSYHTGNILLEITSNDIFGETGSMQVIMSR